MRNIIILQKEYHTALISEVVTITQEEVWWCEQAIVKLSYTK